MRKLSSIIYQEVWRFKGYSLPPKGLIMCDTLRVLVIENQSLALIDLRKKDIRVFMPNSEDLFKGVATSHPM